MCKLLSVFGPFGPRVGGCTSVGVYIGIVYIMPTIGGICVSFWVSLGPSGPGWEDVCQLVFTLVLYISCQQLGYV